EHEGDAAVLRDMGGGFVAAARDVDIGDGSGIDHPETIHPLGRQIDASIGWRRRHEEDLLRFDKALDVFGDAGPEIAHAYLDEYCSFTSAWPRISAQRAIPSSL